MILPSSIGIALMSLLLTACGATGSDCKTFEWTGKFGICIVDGWERVPENILRKEGVPEETLAAFQMKDNRGGQRDNIVMSHERLPVQAAAMKYAEANARTVGAMPEYSLIEKREVKIGGEETVLHIFTARPVPDIPARRFYQLSLTEDTTGYVLTGTLPFSVSEDTEKNLISMMMSVTLEEEEEK